MWLFLQFHYRTFNGRATTLTTIKNTSLGCPFRIQLYPPIEITLNVGGFRRSIQTIIVLKVILTSDLGACYTPCLAPLPITTLGLLIMRYPQSIRQVLFSDSESFLIRVLFEAYIRKFVNGLPHSHHVG